MDAETLVYYKKGEEEWQEPLVLSNHHQATSAKIILYPNPLQRGETLHLQIDNFIAEQWTIFNSQGIEVYSSATDASQAFLDLSKLNPGIYLVRLVNSKKEMINEKLLIK